MSRQMSALEMDDHADDFAGILRPEPARQYDYAVWFDRSGAGKGRRSPWGRASLPVGDPDRNIRVLDDRCIIAHMLICLSSPPQPERTPESNAI